MVEFKSTENPQDILFGRFKEELVKANPSDRESLIARCFGFDRKIEAAEFGKIVDLGYQKEVQVTKLDSLCTDIAALMVKVGNGRFEPKHLNVLMASNKANGLNLQELGKSLLHRFQYCGFHTNRIDLNFVQFAKLWSPPFLSLEEDGVITCAVNPSDNGKLTELPLKPEFELDNSDLVKIFADNYDILLDRLLVVRNYDTVDLENKVKLKKFRLRVELAKENEPFANDYYQNLIEEMSKHLLSLKLAKSQVALTAGNVQEQFVNLCCLMAVVDPNYSLLTKYIHSLAQMITASNVKKFSREKHIIIDKLKMELSYKKFHVKDDKSILKEIEDETIIGYAIYFFYSAIFPTFAIW